VTPVAGPASGGDLVRLVGTGFAPKVAVRFGERAATDRCPSVTRPASASWTSERLRTKRASSTSSCRTSTRTGVPVAGESVLLAGAYRFARATVAREADLTRVVRQLLRELKRQVLANVSATVSVDYDDTVIDGLNVIAMAKVPSLVLSGPTLRPNRFYSANVPTRTWSPASRGPSWCAASRRTPWTSSSR
jgi:hypothetical protein